MDGAHATPEEAPREAVERSRRWLGAILGLAVLGYVAYAVWQGLRETTAELWAFSWPLYVPVLALTLVNYGLRYLKWALLLRRLGVDMPARANAWAFVAGLGMVISPGKAGELVKPWVVREVTGTPMVRTIPALITERLTDGIAVVLLAAVGVSTFYPENTALIAGTLAGCAVVIAALAFDPLGRAALAVLGALPVVGRFADRLAEAYDAMRTCVSPAPLLITLGLSLVAWWAECVGYWLVFRGLGVPAGLDASTFLYAFATVFGAPSPGGLGMADVALVETSVRLVPGLTDPAALAAALLIRVATLWFGVLMGAVALLRLDDVIRAARTP